MIRGILDAIYEPIFEKVHKNCNFGFREHLGTRQAIEKLQRETKGMNIVLEGDIKSAFPTVDHDILMDILKEKINDDNFLKLIYRGHPVVGHEGHYEHTLLGTPQGGIASPILFNI
jgi:retron-type reverse transcriptase